MSNLDGDSTTGTKFEVHTEADLGARAAHPGSTLADLYDPEVMPAELRQAHRALDAAVDRLYKRGGFSDDRERVEYLFGLYEALIAKQPLVRPAKPRRERQAAVSAS